MKFRVKAFLHQYCPPLFSLGRLIRGSLHRSRQKSLAAQIPPVQKAVLERHGFVVQTGPFQGMKYEPQTMSFSDAFLPRLIGSYESQTHEAIETALSRAPSAIVDIGCEEGYCAVGLARRDPQRKVYAFDIEEWARRSCLKLAERNDVADRVILGGACTPAVLANVLPANAFVFCDCEGYEYELLDAAQVPALRSADMLVELHDFVRLDLAITPAVLARFGATHDITIMEFGVRDPQRYRCLDHLPPGKRRLALHEDRMPGQQWAFLQAKSRAAPALAK